MNILKTMPHRIFRRTRIQELCKGSLHDHALADARTFSRSFELLVNFLGDPDGYFAGCQGIPLVR